MYRLFPRLILIACALVLGTRVVLAQSACTTCLQKVQVDVSLCNAQLPSEVHPKDPKNPTDAERKAASDRAAKSRACVKMSTDRIADCKRTAGCP
jgi:hypothetical protein